MVFQVWELKDDKTKITILRERVKELERFILTQVDPFTLDSDNQEFWKEILEKNTND